MIRLSHFFKDKNNRYVIAQFPNPPLIGWFIFTMMNLLWSADQPKMHAIFALLSYGFIFTWAWLEITEGVNYFRRVLGLLVLGIVIYFRL